MYSKFIGYQCSTCNRNYSVDEITYSCPEDGGNLNVILDYKAIVKNIQPKDIYESRERSLWRYLPILPVEDPGGIGTPLRKAGYTPVYHVSRLAKKLGIA